MFAHLKGTVEYRGENWIALDINGVGYKVVVSGSVMDKAVAVGNEIKVYTYTHVREDGISIFGFSSMDELRLFESFISVSGIGPKVALNILSSGDPVKLAMAVAGADIDLLTSVPGIGKKTAQRIILELRDKMNMEDLLQTEVIMNNSEDRSTFREAANALINLGYSGFQAKKALDAVNQPDIGTEEMIKAALKHMGK